MRRSVAFVVGLAAAVLMAACGGGDKAPQSPIDAVRKPMSPARVVTTDNGRGVVVLPPGWAHAGTRVAAIYLHTYGADAKQVIGLGPNGKAAAPRLAALTRAIAVGGVPVVAIDAGGDAWGNDAAMAAIDAAIRYAWGPLGAQSGKVVLIGASMGGLEALVWAASHRAETAAIVGIVPAVDFNAIYDSPTRAFRAAIDGAYGGDSSQVRARDPLSLARAGRFSGLPITLYYGTRDVIATPRSVQAFAAAVGPTATATPVTGIHNTVVDSLPVNAIARFVLTHG